MKKKWSANEAVATIASELPPPPAQLGKEAYELSRQSLETVSHLSEYIEEQATRLLTGVGLLAAVAGAAYTALKPEEIFGKGMLSELYQWLFFGFVLTLCFGTIFALLTIRPFFRMWWQDPDAAQFSKLFAMQIGQMNPARWAGAFCVDERAMIDDYARTQIIETYVISQKVRTKHATLRIGFWLGYIPSLALLMAWVGLVLYGFWASHWDGPRPDGSATTKAVAMLIVTDADNTLWDTNAVYAKAQNSLLEGIERILGARIDGSPVDRLKSVRELDQKLCRQEGTFRYAPILLVAALEESIRAKGNIFGTPTNEQRGKLADDFVLHLRAFPELRPGVREAMAQLRANPNVQLSVLSEGDPEKVSLSLERYSLRQYVDSIDMVNGKTVEGFVKVAHQHGVMPSHAIAIGDQLAREIKAAKEAGYTTVFFPGGFEIYDEIAEIQADYTIRDSFIEIVAIAEEVCRKLV